MPEAEQIRRAQLPNGLVASIPSYLQVPVIPATQSTHGPQPTRSSHHSQQSHQSMASMQSHPLMQAQPTLAVQPTQPQYSSNTVQLSSSASSQSSASAPSMSHPLRQMPSSAQVPGIVNYFTTYANNLIGEQYANMNYANVNMMNQPHYRATQQYPYNM